MYSFIRATEEHIKPLLDNIVLDVKEEMAVIQDIGLFDIVSEMINGSDEAWVALDKDNEIICMFGIRSVSLLSDTGLPWLITTNLISSHRKNFLWLSKVGIAHWLKKYKILVNYIPQGFPRLLRWLEYTGFRVYPATPVGIHQRYTHKIEMRQ